jgi:hypothetical protein
MSGEQMPTSRRRGPEHVGQHIDREPVRQHDR